MTVSIIAADVRASIWEFESRASGQRSLARFGAYGAEANINRPTASAESVENGPISDIALLRFKPDHGEADEG